MLEKGDVRVESDMKFSFGNASFPTETAEKARLDPIDTVAPTVLYILAALSTFLTLVTIPKGCCGLKWSFGRKLLNLCMVAVAFAAIAAASSLWTYKVSYAVKELSTGDTNVKYFEDVYAGKSFLAMTWLASILTLVAMLLLAVELGLDKRQAKGAGNDRRSFIKIADSEHGVDEGSKSSVNMAAWEQKPPPSGRMEMPGYEPLRA